ncbi:SAM-dependent methyltransferase [Pseudomonas sp. W4I3]|uniref:SAM-dependent methyltransferase n=1 Tax=Pseudomonas sp. W4I3 TaxID=3042294 RepID=UPI00278619D4|nr:SAM-dependent methyltransferase [Pseudomonas sp. W4I3]MDQ0740220.1 SAM-dependent methyltransferase [Pseudomonas sp. W4I3]
MSVTTPYFDQMFAGNDDPWAFRQRWYEQRKRAVSLAVLTRAHYASIFEPGCANGELSADLAARCDRLLCCDTASAAVTLAKKRLAGFSNVLVEQRRLPEQWPSEQFELIVLSELCYYLDAADLERLIDRCLEALAENGQLLACHWRAPIEGCPQTAEQVHALLHQRLRLHAVVRHHEEDFLLDLWSRDSASVARLEGLR